MIVMASRCGRPGVLDSEVYMNCKLGTYGLSLDQFAYLGKNESVYFQTVGHLSFDHGGPNLPGQACGPARNRGFARGGPAADEGHPSGW